MRSYEHFALIYIAALPMGLPGMQPLSALGDDLSKRCEANIARARKQHQTLHNWTNDTFANEHAALRACLWALADLGCWGREEIIENNYYIIGYFVYRTTFRAPILNKIS